MDYRNEVLADNPLAFWEFKDGSNVSTVNDYTLTQFNGGVHRGLGPKNSDAVWFDNIAWRSIGGLPDFQDGTFTVEMWVKYGTQTMDYPTFIRRDGGGSAFLMRTRGPNVGTRIYQIETYTNGETLVSNTTWNDNAWHHVVFRSNAYSGTLYVDGVVRSVKNGAQSAGGTGSAAVLYLGRGSDTTEFFSGSIANVAIYTTDIGAARISAHYNAPPNDLPFVGWGVPL